MKVNIFFQCKRIYLYSDLCFGVNWAPLKDLTVFVQPQIGCFSWRSFGRPHTVALFPIKKPFCRGSSGSHASKYIHFHRKCFVLEVQCFLGLLCSHSTQVGFLYMCAEPQPLHHAPPQHSPYTLYWRIQTKPTCFSPARYGLVICKGSALEKTKQRSCSLLCLEAACECVCVCLPHCICYTQTNKTRGSTNQQGNLQQKWNCVGGIWQMFIVWPTVEMRPHCSVF